MTGRFITLEGLEGTGKSTQISGLRDRLAACGIQVVVTREPGGTPLAEKLRELVLHAGPEKVPPRGELLIMFAARAVHLETLIRPALARGEWVLCDRFTDASYAYQGAGRGVPEEHIRSLEALVQQGLKPDLTLLLDAPVEVGLARARARRGLAAADRFEREEMEFFQRVRAAFLEIARREPQRVKLIDADRAPEVVAADLQARVLKLLPAKPMADGR
jgi:dTMP kinase